MGVIEPIVVREVDGDYKVVAGQRRTLAAQAVEDVDSVPARIMEMDDAEARMVSITENAEQFKKDVPPEDRALSIRELLNDGYSVSEIAERMGSTEPTIRRWVEPARSYWEDTAFYADPEDDDKDGELEDISLEAMKQIRKATSNKDRRERIAKKVVQKNIKNKQVREATKRSETGGEFENEINRIIREIESDIYRVREEVYFSGEPAELLDTIMKDRGIGEKDAIESLLRERLEQIKCKNKGEWVGLSLDQDVVKALDEILEDRDLPRSAIVKGLVERKLEDVGYL
jgi:ParB-like chromosome segregation protein Spo0J